MYIVWKYKGVAQGEMICCGTEAERDEYLAMGMLDVTGADWSRVPEAEPNSPPHAKPVAKAKEVKKPASKAAKPTAKKRTATKQVKKA